MLNEDDMDKPLWEEVVDEDGKIFIVMDDELIFRVRDACAPDEPIPTDWVFEQTGTIEPVSDDPNHGNGFTGTLTLRETGDVIAHVFDDGYPSPYIYTPVDSHLWNNFIDHSMTGWSNDTDSVDHHIAFLRICSRISELGLS